MPFALSACATVPAPPPPEPRIWSAEGPPRAVLVALHSFGDHDDAFNLAAPALADAGYTVYAFDQAGFGDRTLLDGRWAGEQRLVADAADLVRRAARQHPDRPLYLLGESLGGAVAILVAARHPELPVDGLILAAPAVREGIRLRYGWNVLIATAATLAPGYKLNVSRPPDDPRLAPAAARRLADDPQVMRRVRLDAYWGLIKLADSASDAAPELTRPTLVLYGGEDTSVPAISIRRLNQHLGERGDYRYFADGPHLLLQGRHWPAVVDAIEQWLATLPH